MANSISEKWKENIFILYRNVKYLREKEGLSLREFSKITGISVYRLKRVEQLKEIGILTDIHIRDIALYFHISPQLLFDTDLSVK